MALPVFMLFASSGLVKYVFPQSQRSNHRTLLAVCTYDLVVPPL